MYKMIQRGLIFKFIFRDKLSNPDVACINKKVILIHLIISKKKSYDFF